MAATELDPVETESEKVERWRAETLEKVGYDIVSAHELAAQAGRRPAPGDRARRARMQARARAEDPAVGLILHARRRSAPHVESFPPRFLGEHGSIPCSPNSSRRETPTPNAAAALAWAESLAMALARIHPFALERSHPRRAAHDPPVRAHAPRRDPRVRLADDGPLEAGGRRLRPRHPRHRLGASASASSAHASTTTSPRGTRCRRRSGRASSRSGTAASGSGAGSCSGRSPA